MSKWGGAKSVIGISSGYFLITSSFFFNSEAQEVVGPKEEIAREHRSLSKGKLQVIKTS